MDSKKYTPEEILDIVDEYALSLELGEEIDDDDIALLDKFYTLKREFETNKTLSSDNAKDLESILYTIYKKISSNILETNGYKVNSETLARIDNMINNKIEDGSQKYLGTVTNKIKSSLEYLAKVSPSVYNNMSDLLTSDNNNPVLMVKKVKDLIDSVKQKQGPEYNTIIDTLNDLLKSVKERDAHVIQVSNNLEKDIYDNSPVLLPEVFSKTDLNYATDATAEAKNKLTRNNIEKALSSVKSSAPNVYKDISKLMTDNTDAPVLMVKKVKDMLKLTMKQTGEDYSTPIDTLNTLMNSVEDNDPNIITADSKLENGTYGENPVLMPDDLEKVNYNYNDDGSHTEQYSNLCAEFKTKVEEEVSLLQNEITTIKQSTSATKDEDVKILEKKISDLVGDFSLAVKSSEALTSAISQSLEQGDNALPNNDIDIGLRSINDLLMSAIENNILGIDDLIINKIKEDLPLSNVVEETMKALTVIKNAISTGKTAKDGLGALSITDIDFFKALTESAKIMAVSQTPTLVTDIIDIVSGKRGESPFDLASRNNELFKGYTTSYDYKILTMYAKNKIDLLMNKSTLSLEKAKLNKLVSEYAESSSYYYDNTHRTLYYKDAYKIVESYYENDMFKAYTKTNNHNLDWDNKRRKLLYEVDGFYDHTKINTDIKDINNDKGEFNKSELIKLTEDTMNYVSNKKIDVMLEGGTTTLDKKGKTYSDFKKNTNLADVIEKFKKKLGISTDVETASDIEINGYNRFISSTPATYQRGGRGYLFITRPSLNLSEENLNQSEVLKTIIEVKPWIRDYLDDSSSLLTPFIPLLTNAATSLPIPDLEISEKDIFQDRHNTIQRTPGFIEDSKKTANMTITFKDNRYKDVRDLIQVWVQYQSEMEHGDICPTMTMAREGRLDYLASAYVINTLEDGETISSISKWTGSCPKIIPASGASYKRIKTMEDVNSEMEVPFFNIEVDPLNLYHIADFNSIVEKNINGALNSGSGGSKIDISTIPNYDKIFGDNKDPNYASLRKASLPTISLLCDKDQNYNAGTVPYILREETNSEYHKVKFKLKFI